MYFRLLSFLDNKKKNNFSITISLVFALNTQTEHACMALLKFIHKVLDRGRIPAAIFLDVRKAFDSI